MCPQFDQFYKTIVLRLNEHADVIEKQTIEFVHLSFLANSVSAHHSRKKALSNTSTTSRWLINLPVSNRQENMTYPAVSEVLWYHENFTFCLWEFCKAKNICKFLKKLKTNQNIFLLQYACTYSRRWLRLTRPRNI